MAAMNKRTDRRWRDSLGRNLCRAACRFVALLLPLAPVRLPASAATTASAERNLVIAVDAAGTLSLEGRALGRNELVAELRRRAAAAPGRPALVQGDARTPFAAMTRALEAVGEAGITEVRFAAEPVESK